MKQFLFLLAVAVSSSWVIAADSGQVTCGSFEGSVIVEWLDDPYVLKMRLTRDFAFRQADGKTWLVPADAIVDGRSMPRLFVSLTGRPFNSAFRKTTLVYDYAAKAKRRSWDEAQAMFYEGALSEGIVPVEAKVIYMLLSATGLRWAVRGDRDCYGRCHSVDANLEWSPKVREEEVVALVSWVRSEDPPLDEIERRVGKVILDDSPHMIGRIYTAPEQQRQQ